MNFVCIEVKMQKYETLEETIFMQQVMTRRKVFLVFKNIFPIKAIVTNIIIITII